MLNLVLGRGDTDLEGVICRRAAAETEAGAGRRYLIVPDYASHEMERKLCAVGGDTVSMRAEVLSLTRLAGRVFACAGGTAEPVLDAGGRVLLLATVLKEISPALTVYAKPSAKPAFLEQMLSTIDELKTCCVTPEQLSRAGEENERLRDIALIYGAYEAVTARTAADPRDRFTRLNEKLRESGWAAGKEFFLLGFTDFTAQEREVIATLIEDAQAVTCGLLCDGPEGTDPLFEEGRKTARQLLRMAADAGRESTVEQLRIRRDRPEELAHLERELFSDHPRPWNGCPERIALFRAESLRGEVEWAAARLRRLAAEEGVRCREMMVAARDFEAYRALIETIFPQYGLPVFTSAMTDVLEKPVLAVVSAALDVLENNWAEEDVFRYLKTGLTGLTADEADRLENYAETWDIRGTKWLKPWLWRPDGQFGACGEEDPALAELNALRERVCAPLLHWKQAGGRTGRDQAAALYAFLEEICLPDRLAERTSLLREKGLRQRAEEYRQLWEILCRALDQCAVILKETTMDREEFGRLLKLVLSQYDVGAIPVSLDRVTAGELPRVSWKSCRVLCLLGADDGSIPQTAGNPGLLTDEDRELLAGMDVTVAPPAAEKLEREWTSLYEGCICPSERLWVFYPLRGTGGEEKRPSVLVKRLQKAFPALPVQTEGEGNFRLSAPLPALQSGREEVWPALKALPAFAPRVERMERAGQLTRGNLSPAAVEALYGRRVPMSASRLDKYQSCHFSYFMQYGLKAKARRRAGFSAPEYGTFVHYVLEQVLRDGGQDRTKQQREQMVDRAVESYVTEQLGGLEHQTPRFRYLFRRLRRSVLAVVENAVGELARSDFRPVAFELGFGTGKQLPPVTFEADGVTISLSGFVDRVDGWEKDGRLYLRVVDYKTGRKSFDWSDVFHGMGLQMLVYLSALKEKGGALFDREIVPAGVLYFPAREAVIAGPPDLTDAQIAALMDRELVRKGVVLEDAGVIEAMEHPGEEGYRYLPLKVSSKTGTITGEALVSAEKLGRLEQHVANVFRELAGEMARGTITADPFWRGVQKNACLYCEYAAACQFREGHGGDRRRPMKNMKQAQFWERLDRKEETEHGLSAD